jgi:hypothetical protein
VGTDRLQTGTRQFWRTANHCSACLCKPHYFKPNLYQCVPHYFQPNLCQCDASWRTRTCVLARSPLTPNAGHVVCHPQTYSSLEHLVSQQPVARSSVMGTDKFLHSQKKERKLHSLLKCWAFYRKCKGEILWQQETRRFDLPKRLQMCHSNF